MSGASDLQSFLRDNVPLAAATQMRIGEYDNHTLTVSAPLAANRNHHGTAFGGSLYVVALAAGWGLVDMLLHQNGIRAATYVQHAEADYQKPVTEDFTARAVAPGPAAVAGFLATLQRRGRARLPIAIAIDQDGTSAFQLQARFVAQTGQADDRE